MALSAKLNLRQSQSMVMTPQLLQSIRLLQFTQLELDQFVQDQIEINPLLEREASQDNLPVADRSALPEPDLGSEANASEDWSMNELEVSSSAIADKLDSSLDNVFPDDPGHSESGSPAQGPLSGRNGSDVIGRPESDFDLESVIAGSLTLDGFFTRDQDQFFLQLRQTEGQEEVLGLLMATRLPE